MLLQPPMVRKPPGLGSSHFERHYFGNRYFFLFLQVLRCFSSPGSPQFHNWYTAFSRVGCPIRTFADQVLFADPRDFSQLTTSFIGLGSQGILRSLFFSFSFSESFFNDTRFAYFEIVVPYRNSKKLEFLILD